MAIWAIPRLIVLVSTSTTNSWPGAVGQGDRAQVLGPAGAIGHGGRTEREELLLRGGEVDVAGGRRDRSRWSSSGGPSRTPVRVRKRGLSQTNGCCWLPLKIGPLSGRLVSVSTAGCAFGGRGLQQVRRTAQPADDPLQADVGEGELAGHLGTVEGDPNVARAGRPAGVVTRIRALPPVMMSGRLESTAMVSDGSLFCDPITHGDPERPQAGRPSSQQPQRQAVLPPTASGRRSARF